MFHFMSAFYDDDGKIMTSNEKHAAIWSELDEGKWKEFHIFMDSRTNSTESSIHNMTTIYRTFRL